MDQVKDAFLKALFDNPPANGEALTGQDLENIRTQAIIKEVRDAANRLDNLIHKKKWADKDITINELEEVYQKLEKVFKHYT